MAASETKMEVTEVEAVANETKMAITKSMIVATNSKIVATKSKIVANDTKIVATKAKIADTKTKMVAGSEIGADTETKMVVIESEIEATKIKMTDTEIKTVDTESMMVDTENKIVTTNDTTNDITTFGRYKNGIGGVHDVASRHAFTIATNCTKVPLSYFPHDKKSGTIPANSEVSSNSLDDTVRPCSPAKSELPALFAHNPYDSTPCSLNISDVNMSSGRSLKQEMWRCHVCGVIFPNQISLTAHRPVHMLDIRKCTICGLAFESLPSLRIHFDECRKNYTAGLNTTAAMVTSDPSVNVAPMPIGPCVSGKPFEYKPWSCAECGHAFVTRKNLDAHAKIHKSGPHACVVCGMMFTYFSSLEIHNKSHIAEAMQEYELPNNGLVATTELPQHQSVVSLSSGKIHKCSKCPSSFRTSALLMRHEFTHMKHVCTQCGKWFKSAGRLKTHMVVHTGERPFTCSICRLTFQWSSAQHRHMKKMHPNSDDNQPVTTGKWPCMQCEKKFASKNALDRHVVGHADKIVHRCEVCAETFQWSYGLQQHKLTHVGDSDKTGSSNHSASDDIDGVSVNQECAEVGSSSPHTGDASQKVFNGLDLSTNAAAIVITPGEQSTTTSVLDSSQVSKADAASPASTDQSAKPKVWPCTVCGKNFVTKYTLAIHVAVHTGEMPYTCSVCGEKFRWPMSLSNHKSIHAATLPYKCELCPKSFNARYKLKNHMLTAAHSGEKPHKCFICGKQFKSRDHLKQHQNAHSTKYACSVCEKCFHSSKILQTHMLTHTGEKPHECRYCGKRFSQLAALSVHRALHTGERPYKCGLCDAAFLSSNNLKKHLRTHVVDSGTGKRANVENYSLQVVLTQRPHACKFCSKRFIWKDDLFDHEAKHKNDGDDSEGGVEQKNPPADASIGDDNAKQPVEEFKVTLNQKPHECELCHKRFVWEEELKQHQAWHRGDQLSMDKNKQLSSPPDGRLTCVTCGKVLASVGSLRSHLGTHRGERRFPCKVCGKRFTQSVSMKKHYMALHTNERPYKCTFCDKAFIMPEPLRVHLCMHTGELPIKCEICGKGFASKVRLKKHMTALVHSKQKPHICLICGNTFKRRSLLKRHSTTHSRNNPNRCPLCKKGFPSGQALESHTYIHTGEKPFSCDLCGRRFSQQGSMRIHRRTHKNLGRHQCMLCDERFKTSTFLDTHLRLHVGEPLNVCGVCGLGFIEKASLAAHMQVHSGEDHTCCGECVHGFAEAEDLHQHLVAHLKQAADYLKHHQYVFPVATQTV